MEIDIINLKTGVFNFGNQEFITAKTTFEEMLKMKGTIVHSFENLDLGIQSVSYDKKEIEGVTCQVSFHFQDKKLSMVFVIFEDGKQLLETALWGSLKQIKTNKHTQKGDISKRKNFDWGSVFASYAQKVNLGQFNISYK